MKKIKELDYVKKNERLSFIHTITAAVIMVLSLIFFICFKQIISEDIVRDICLVTFGLAYWTSEESRVEEGRISGYNQALEMPENQKN